MPPAPEPPGTVGPPGRGRRRGLVAVASVGGLVVILAVVFTLAGWLGSPADDSASSGSGTDQAVGPPGPTGTATVPRASGTGAGSSPGSGGGSAGGTASPTGSGVPPVLPSAGPTGTGTGKAPTVLVGTGCPLTGGRSVATSGKWGAQKSGGWSDDGCDGGYLTHRTTASAADSVTWQFPTKATTSCAVEVYVPVDGTAPAAFYNIISGSDINSFTLNQASNHGRWVAAGSFPAQPGPVSVRLSDRGDGKSVVAADAVRLTCH